MTTLFIRRIMLSFVLECVITVMLVVIATCQIKQAYFPVVYPDYESNIAGVEVPKDADISENDPMYKMVADAYERSRQFAHPSAFLQKTIDEPGDTGVEIITDKEEYGGY